MVGMEGAALRDVVGVRELRDHLSRTFMGLTADDGAVRRGPRGRPGAGPGGDAGELWTRPRAGARAGAAAVRGGQAAARVNGQDLRRSAYLAIDPDGLVGEPASTRRSS
jgi:hypothetical protein